MQNARRMIVDMSSLLWQSLLAGKDEEYGITVEFEGKQVQVNSYHHGYECAMNHLTSVMEQLNIVPTQMIFVVEGMHSKVRRKAMYDRYKSGGGRPEECYTNFNILKDMLIRVFRSVGATFVSQDGVESDDVIAYLVRRLKGDKIIVSRDGDLCALLADDVIQVRNGQLTIDNPYGIFPPKYITTYKAVVGDSSDKLSGAPGFGETAFSKLLDWAGLEGLEMLDTLIKKRELHTLEEDVASFKPMRKLIDGAESVYTCYQVATLHDEWVNTLRQPLQWKAGMVKPAEVVDDHRLVKYCQNVQLVTMANFEQAFNLFKAHIGRGPIVALDIEASTPDESDDWLRQRGAESKFDGFGFEMDSMSLTFGENNEHTLYFSVNHANTDNITSDMLLEVIKSIPKSVRIVIQNWAFEGPVLYALWGEHLKDNGWHGFLPDVMDTAILSSYVDENVSSGLKQNSKLYLDYDQVSYEQVTTFEGKSSELPAGGKLLHEEAVFKKQWKREVSMIPVYNEQTGEDEWAEELRDGEPVFIEREETVMEPKMTAKLNEEGEEVLDESGAVIMIPVLDDKGNPVMVEAVDHYRQRVQYKMRELSGEHVLHYGADDTICTAALFNFYRIITEIEGTWDLINQIEIKPQYLTNLAFHHGTDFSLSRMKELMAEDEQASKEAWATVRDYLISVGWEGTVTPVYSELTPAVVKEIVAIVLGLELKTMVRKIDKLGKLVASLDHEDAEALGQMIEREELGNLNAWVAKRFDGEPKLDVNSPKVMRRLLYTTMGLTIRLINPATETERKEKQELANACYKHGALSRRGLDLQPVSDEEYAEKKVAWSRLSRADQQSNPLPLTLADVELLKAKATTDDTAVDFALAFDLPNKDDPRRATLEALKIMKTVDTRFKMFYKPYAYIRHWKDGKIHASARQCGTVTRRWSYSDPNLQQLPKRGEGVKFRTCFTPHHSDAVIVSADFSAQEIRLMAGLSLDRELLSCYVGDNLRDMHSITAAGSMKLVWSKETYEGLLGHLDGSVNTEDEYAIFRALLAHSDKAVKSTAKDLRTLSKGTNFSAGYGAEYNKLSQILVVDLEVATALLDAKRSKFWRYEEWKKEVERETEKTGVARTLLGGIRHLRKPMLSEQAWERAAASRQASNFEIQSAGAELAKAAMGRVWDSGSFFNLDARFFALVHDELVWSVHKDHAYESICTIWDAMSQPYTPEFAVPFYGSVSIGLNFGDQVELYDDPVRPTKERVEEVLAELFAEA